MGLTTKEIDNLKPTKDGDGKDIPNRKSDGDNLYIHVSASGRTKSWQLRYIFNGKRHTIAIGKYSVGNKKFMGIKEARSRAYDIQKQITNGIDPKEEIRKQKIISKTFYDVATEWFNRFSIKWTERHKKTVWARIENHIFPTIKNIGIAEIEKHQITKIISKIEENQNYETAHRIFNIIDRIIIYAYHEDYIDRYITLKMGKNIAPIPTKNFPGITNPKELGILLNKIDEYSGNPVVKYALQLLAHVFIRSRELRFAEWNEIDFENEMWVIPAERMKKDREHLIPLSIQSLSILNELKTINHTKKFVFNSPHKNTTKPISENTTNKALRKMGYDTKNVHCTHGFRTTASTLLHELDYNSDHIEIQLSHILKDKTKGAYNKAKHIEKRTKMMQEWSNYLDELKLRYRPE